MNLELCFEYLENENMICKKKNTFTGSGFVSESILFEELKMLE